MERKLVDGGEQWLPFARSRIKALRAGPNPYGSQRFTMPDDATVAVRIDPHNEYITINGNLPWEYRVWPTSKEHPYGVYRENADKLIPPESVMALKTGTLRVQKNTEAESQGFDWISYDGINDKGDKSYGKHAVTWGGASFRYPFGTSRASPEVNSGIVHNGVFVTTQHRVEGACYFRGKTSDGVTVERIIYAYKNLTTYGSSVLMLSSFDPNKEVKSGGVTSASVELPVGGYDSGTPLEIVTHPAFFSGAASKLISCVETVTLIPDGSGGNFVQIGKPRYILRGTINMDDSGVLTSSWSRTLYAGSEEFVNRTTIVSVPPFYIESLYTDFYTDNTSGITSFGEDKDGFRYPSRSWSKQTGNATSDKRSRLVDFIGVDMDVDGNESIIERLRDSYETISAVANWEQNYSQSWETYGRDGISSLDSRSGGVESHIVFASSDTIMINGSTFLSIVRESIDNVRVITSGGSGYSTYVNYVKTDYDNGTYSDTSHYVLDNSDFSIRDFDARYKAIVYVLGEYTINPDLSGNSNYQSKLCVKLESFTQSKYIFNGDISARPVYANTDVFIYRQFGVRRPGEFAVCANADTNLHNVPTVTPTSGYLQDLARLGGTVDQTPILTMRRDGKVVEYTKKFKIGAEANFRIDPIQLI